MDPRILSNFYRCTIESILTGCITAWYGNRNNLERNALQRVEKTVQHITRTGLPAMQELYTQSCSRETSLIRGCSHHNNKLLTELPSGRRYRSIRTSNHQIQRQLLPPNHKTIELSTDHPTMHKITYTILFTVHIFLQCINAIYCSCCFLLTLTFILFHCIYFIVYCQPGQRRPVRSL